MNKPIQGRNRNDQLGILDGRALVSCLLRA